MEKCQRILFSSQREDCRRWNVLRNRWSFKRLQLNQLKTSRQNMKQMLERKSFQTKNLSSNIIYQLSSGGQEERLGNLLSLKMVAYAFPVVEEGIP